MHLLTQTDFWYDVILLHMHQCLSAGCSLAGRACVTSSTRCMCYSSWSIVHSYLLHLSAMAIWQWFVSCLVWSTVQHLLGSIADIGYGLLIYRDIKAPEALPFGHWIASSAVCLVYFPGHTWLWCRRLFVGKCTSDLVLCIVKSWLKEFQEKHGVCVRRTQKDLPLTSFSFGNGSAVMTAL